MPAEPPPKVIDPDYLTGVLHRSGVQGDARVRTVVVESSRPTILSRIDRLRLEYAGAAADAPGSIILKTGLHANSGEAWNSGRQEVAFYTHVAPTLSTGLVPRCFDADWNADTHAWHILLEDLTDTHFIPTIWPLPPTLEQCQTIIAARARVHAAWWDDPRLGYTMGMKYDMNTTDQYVRDLTRHVAGFAERLGDRLARERLELYERFLDAAPRLLGRHRSHRDLTIIHGDSHVWNAFLPRDGGGDVRLFDWDGWRVGLATNDLAYMMATHWYPDCRRRFERPLLDHYHAALLANGVRGYDRGALDDDYRLSVLMQIATPVWHAAFDLPPMIWWSHLERIMLAVEDLGCRDLLA